MPPFFRQCTPGPAGTGPVPRVGIQGHIVAVARGYSFSIQVKSSPAILATAVAGATNKGQFPTPVLSNV